MSNASGQGDLCHPVFILDRANIFQDRSGQSGQPIRRIGRREPGAGKSFGKAANSPQNRE